MTTPESSKDFKETTVGQLIDTEKFQDEYLKSTIQDKKNDTICEEP